MNILEIAEKIIRGEQAITFPLKNNSGWVSDQNGHHILDIRGWGFIQYIEGGDGVAAALQDAIGDWVVKTLNDDYDRMVAQRKSLEV